MFKVYILWHILCAFYGILFLPLTHLSKLSELETKVVGEEFKTKVFPAQNGCESRIIRAKISSISVHGGQTYVRG